MQLSEGTSCGPSCRQVSILRLHVVYAVHLGKNTWWAHRVRQTFNRRRLEEDCLGNTNSILHVQDTSCAWR